jgi:hypothetical protein
MITLTGRIAAYVLLAFGVSSCGHGISGALPSPTFEDRHDSKRLQPIARISRFNSAYRSTTGDQEGVAQLINPPTIRSSAAWEYVFLARDYRVRSDTGGAIRGYWAALTITGTTVASRADRERVRRVAYAGLGELAANRLQPMWAEMLFLCSSLSGTYLSSPQARVEHERFYSQVARVRAMQRDIEDKQNSNSRQGIIAVLGALATTATKGDTATANRRVTEHFRADSALHANLAPIVAVLADDASKFREMVSREVGTVEGGQSFLATEVAAALTTAEDKQPYLSVLARFVAGKPALREALAGYSASPDSVSLSNLVHLFQQYEIHVAATERSRGRLLAPR